jgi:hypothetical protein
MTTLTTMNINKLDLSPKAFGKQQHVKILAVAATRSARREEHIKVLTIRHAKDPELLAKKLKDYRMAGYERDNA